MDNQPQVQVNLPGRPLWADLLILLLPLLAAGGAMYLSLPGPERQLLKMHVTARLHRSVAVRAWRAGRAGMAEELAGRDPSAFYGSAAFLSRWRDRLADK